MVNDTTTLNGALMELGETMADNLEAMGVLDADANDGLTTLAGKILDIEPSISGLNLDTGINLHSSDDSCVIGQQVLFWAELTATYDDDTLVDVDLSGVLTGATISFKIGNTVVGTGVTDSDGIASYTHTFSSVGDYSVTASFAGTENFDSCISTAIHVSVDYDKIVAQINGSTATLGYYSDASIQGSNWLVSNGDVLIDWGDGSTSTVNNPTTTLTHNYSSSGNHTISLIGDITGIGVACFNQSSVLTSINVPNTVTSVGDYAFFNCTNLSSVTLPNTITSFGKSSFRGCSSLTSVTLPTSLSSVGQACFRETGLTSISIPSTLTTIAQDCFYGCSSLATVTLPNTLTTIGQASFYGCTNLTSVSIPSTVTTLPKDAFYNCSSLASLTLPNSLTSMGENCFRGCSSLTSVTLPNTLSTMGKGCFRQTGLTSITLPNSVNAVPQDCFFGCSSLASISLPNTITSIGQGSFHTCTSLTSFIIPTGVTSISTDAFAYASNLASITIPSTVTSMGATPFKGCSKLLDYQLYWTGNNVITYTSSMMPNANAVFTIPNGETANYVTKSYPSAKLVERGFDIIITCATPIIQTEDTASIVATYKNDGVPVVGEGLNYEIKHGNTLIDYGTSMTDNNGQITISYTGTGVGEVEIIVNNGQFIPFLAQETYNLLDSMFYDTAVTGTNATYFCMNTAGTKTTGATGTTLNGSSGTIQCLAIPNNVTATDVASSRVYSTPYKGEFDIVSLTGNFLITQYTTADQNNRGNVDFGGTNGDHITFWNLGEGKLYFQVNNNNPTIVNRSQSAVSDVAIGLRCSSGNNQLTYKNFKIYPIDASTPV